ncbi:hypothetical protein X777_04766 [Ooceraea biroi]|uniref:Mos1 transposase HTH domain-containing protein n=1 Tax=Ooceraea biroi TaxID=2015173 RepID=A0A026WH61_OOCBI|nr:hypothetical protein X777_04766 [Ooceraea biroi]
MQLPKQHFRHALLLFFNQNKTAADGYRILVKTYGDSAPSIKTCEYWFRHKKRVFCLGLLVGMKSGSILIIRNAENHGWIQANH